MRFGETAAARLAPRGQLGDEPGQRVRVVARSIQDRAGLPVRLQLEALGISRKKDDLRQLGDGFAESGRERFQLPARGFARVDRVIGGDLGDAHALHRREPVAEGDVGDLVRQRRSQLVLAADFGQKAPRHENMASRRGEGVHLGAVEHGEMVARVDRGPRRENGEPLSQLVEVIRELGAIVGFVDREDGGGDRAADVILLLGSDQPRGVGRRLRRELEHRRLVLVQHPGAQRLRGQRAHALVDGEAGGETEAGRDQDRGEEGSAESRESPHRTLRVSRRRRRRLESQRLRRGDRRTPPWRRRRRSRCACSSGNFPPPSC